MVKRKRDAAVAAVRTVSGYHSALCMAGLPFQHGKESLEETMVVPDPFTPRERVGGMKFPHKVLLDPLCLSLSLF